MAKQQLERVLTEEMLLTEYADNGVIVRSEGDAITLLKKKGFTLLNGTYRGKNGKTARIYPIRDAILANEWPYKPIRFKQIGYLVSFGGQAKSCYNLKFSIIKKPII